uniref:HPP transmembrane region domain-containing protein n=1 Tax=Aegilops tauschii subsp. strangulata TaxID=200361 RepID=A0A453H364_AEGTS
MAVLGRIDQMMAFKGVSLTIAPLGAVCAVLFTAPDSPPAKKYNMFVAQIGCAAIGVLALSLFGPGWLARGAALSASIAFMTITGSSHPPGTASLPLLFIDGPKFHHLQLWYA